MNIFWLLDLDLQDFPAGKCPKTTVNHLDRPSFRFSRKSYWMQRQYLEICFTLQLQHLHQIAYFCSVWVKSSSLFYWNYLLLSLCLLGLDLRCLPAWQVLKTRLKPSRQTVLVCLNISAEVLKEIGFFVLFVGPQNASKHLFQARL